MNLDAIIQSLKDERSRIDAALRALGRSGRESPSEKKSLSLFSQEDGRCSESTLGENKSQEVSDLADNHSVCSQGRVMSVIAILRQHP